MVNTKLILYSAGILLLGLLIGGFSTYRYLNNKREKAEIQLTQSLKTIDSLIITEKSNKEATDRILKTLERNVSNYKINIEQRNEDFKNDTTILSSNELIQRIGSRVNND